MIKTLTKAKILRGEIVVPGDKSISHRAVIIGGIALGESVIDGFLDAADTMSTLACYQDMGIESRFDKNKLIIYGKGIHGLRQPQSILDAGNSGTTIRLLSGILAGQKFSTSITGDHYLVKRPMKRIIDPLTTMGAKISSTSNHTPPLGFTLTEKLTAITYELPIASAQVKSSVLLAGLYADGITKIIETVPTRDHTERMLHLKSEKKNGTNIISIDGGMNIPAQEFVVPGDPSSAAFFIVAALLIKNSEIVICNVGLNPTRTGFLHILQDMGGNIVVENIRNIEGEPIGDIIARTSELKTNCLLNGEIIPNIIDEIPILAVAAAFAQGKFEVRKAKDLRNKETDRIAAVCHNLQRMGVTVEEYDDGFAFESKNNVFPTEFNSFGDHRIAMAFGIAALALNGESKIHNAECVAISYPQFWQAVESLQQ